MLGLRREKELTSNPDANVKAATRNGPTTVRPDELAKKVAKRLGERRVSAVNGTTSDGRLVGVCSSDDAEHI